MRYAIPNKIYTLDEYLDLDYETDAKYEFFENGKLIELSGVHYRHSLIAGNILSIFYERLSKDFEFWIGSMKLKVPALPPYRYPNFSISPSKPKFENVGKHQCLVNPIVIGEIYSRETKRYDFGEKFEAYKSIESFREYLLIDQDQKVVTQHIKYDEEIWFQSEYKDGETLRVESLECDLAVDEIYYRIDFES